MHGELCWKMARNAEVNQRMKEERRERILSGALELFARNGLAGTKISDIAKHTGMSNGLVYHYFSSKEEIFTELIRVAFERMLEACRWLEASKLEPHEKIRFAMDELVRTIRTNPDACLYHLLIAQAATSDCIPAGAKDIIESSRQKPYEVIAGIISRGQKSGTIRNGRAKDMAFFFWNTINGLAFHQAMYGKCAQSPQLEPIYSMYYEDEGNESGVRKK